MGEAGAPDIDMIDITLIECRARGCKKGVEPASIVCTAHDDYRCPEIMPADSNHVAERRCRALVKPGERCWRHR